MAESYPAPDPDTEPPAVLGKMDALIARHRGSGIDPNVPVLTDLDPADAFGEIPVLTNVAPMVGDDLMFTPDEIRAEFPQELPTNAGPAPVWRHSPDGPPTEVTDLPVVGDAPMLPESPPIVPAPRPAAAARPAASLNPAPPVLDFPELVLPGSKPAVAKLAPAPAPPPVSGPLMPELALNFDFSLPDEPAATALPASPPAAVPAPMPPIRPAAVAPATTPQALAPAVSAAPAVPPKPVAAPPATVVPAGLVIPPASTSRLVSDEVPELSIELDAASEALHPSNALPAPDPAELTAAILTSLKPEIEKLVRGELAKQIASLHVEVLKRTMGALQPQLDKLVSGKIEEVLNRR